MSRQMLNKRKLVWSQFYSNDFFTVCVQANNDPCICVKVCSSLQPKSWKTCRRKRVDGDLFNRVEKPRKSCQYGMSSNRDIKKPKKNHRGIYFGCQFLFAGIMRTKMIYLFVTIVGLQLNECVPFMDFLRNVLRVGKVSLTLQILHYRSEDLRYIKANFDVIYETCVKISAIKMRFKCVMRKKERERDIYIYIYGGRGKEERREDLFRRC